MTLNDHRSENLPNVTREIVIDNVTFDNEERNVASRKRCGRYSEIRKLPLISRTLSLPITDAVESRVSWLENRIVLVLANKKQDYECIELHQDVHNVDI